jgi:catechol 2,3-dioxygenase-like lactoylglutathione lyase family enzyme
MPVTLDHLILRVNDALETVDFYARILGFSDEGQTGPFTVVRVNEGLTLQLAPWSTKGGEHLAFAMTKAEFDTAFERVRAAGIEYGNAFDAVGNNLGPGEEEGARGMGETVYFFDPNKHLIEIRHYEA